MKEAINRFKVNTNIGEIWCPFVLNGTRARPDIEVLEVPCGGRVSADRFREVSSYIIKTWDVTQGPLTPDAVRLKMVNGSLDDTNVPNANYTGIDCSGFVFQVLTSIVGHELAESIKYEGEETLHEYALSHAGSGGQYQPERNISVARFRDSSRQLDPKEPIRTGDLAVYNPLVEGGFAHIALVRGTKGRRIKMAHSGRTDPFTDIGGVSLFSLPKERLSDGSHGHRGRLTIRRLSIFDQ